MQDDCPDCCIYVGPPIVDDILMPPCGGKYITNNKYTFVAGKKSVSNTVFVNIVNSNLISPHSYNPPKNPDGVYCIGIPPDSLHCLQDLVRKTLGGITLGGDREPKYVEISIPKEEQMSIIKQNDTDIDISIQSMVFLSGAKKKNGWTVYKF